jgi:hypothetical protein
MKNLEGLDQFDFVALAISWACRYAAPRKQGGTRMVCYNDNLPYVCDASGSGSAW